jgi:hypothetical protein
MAAVGWYVQLVHYPSFLFVRPERFAEFHARHAAMTGVLVVPAMFAQLVSAVFVCVQPPDGFSAWWPYLGLVGAVVAWGGTFLQAVPWHNRLAANGWDEAAIRGLVASNLPRTLAWSASFVWALATLDR